MCLVVYFIFKFEMEYLTPASWTYKEKMIYILPIVLSIFVLLFGLSIIKPKFWIKRRASIRNDISTLFTIIFAMGCIIFILITFIQKTLYIFIYFGMIFFPCCYILLDTMLARFAEDAEYCFSECHNILSKIEPTFKNYDDISTFVYYYKKGFKKLNKQLREQLSLSNIKTEDIEVLESIYKKIPYYLLFGENRHLERTKFHINKIQQSLKPPNKLHGELIIGEIECFLNEINYHIGKKEILPYKRSFITEFIRRDGNRTEVIRVIYMLLMLIAAIAASLLNGLSYIS